MPRTKPSVGYHKDGAIWNKGQTLDGEMHGYWEFYRKDRRHHALGPFLQRRAVRRVDDL